MAGPLLRTKSYIPRLHASLVPRPHLIQQLNAALDQKLALISAPAGFGKTTLLSRWVRERQSDDRPVRFCWLSLDRADNDPARFLSYVLMSLQEIEARIGQAELEALKSAGFAKASRLPALEEILTALVNQIAACLGGASETLGQLAESSAPAVRGDLVLVLDDYHVIEAQAVHDALTFLLEHMPPEMHLAIVTRTDPPLPIARLRGQGQVTELRQEDFVFTPEEANQFLNEVMGLHLSQKAAAALAARTEGWIAGLQMAAVSMQGRTDTAAFVEAFTGSDRFIMDYLTSEVLDRQPTYVKTFLLQTSILERLTASLCDAVIGNRAPDEPASNGSPSPTGRLKLDPVDPKSQEILEYLERYNLFVVAQDDHRQWYRYHHLFSDLLRQRLRQTQPDVVPSLHQRASEWYEHQGLIQEAIQHALSADDYERAACLIEHAAEPAWMHSEVTTYLEWVASLPAEIVQSRPMLGIYQAIGLLMDGRPLDAIESELERTASNAKAATGAQEAPISGGLLVFRALVAAYQGRSQESVELTRRALQDVPEGNLFLRSLLSGILGLAHMYSGDFTAADQALREAATSARQAGNIMNTVLALCHLAELSSLAGQLHASQSLYEEALSIAVDAGGGRLPIAGLACIGLGNLHFLWNDLNRAAEQIEQGIELARRWGEAGILRGYSSLARVKIAQGDFATARQLLQTAERIAARFDVTEVDDLSVDMHKAELSIAEGNWQAAMAWAEKRGLTLDPELVHLDIEEDRHLWLHRYFRQREYITLAKLLIPIGLIRDKAPPDGRLPKSSQALEAAAGLLAQLRPALEEKGEILHLVELLSLQGLALATLGHRARALAAVERALLLGRSGGLVRPFVEGGQSMANLLREAVSRNTAPQYARHLLAELGAPGFEEKTEPNLSTSQAVGGRDLLVEPLTERELEVLRYLPSSLTTTEMAEHLIISVNTVRSHIRSIYGKLGVHSRHEAIACAEQLGLL